MVAFAGMTLAERGYVAALAVDAFRSYVSVAVGSVGFRLFAASSARSLLRDVPRMATVRARGPMEPLVLTQVDFIASLSGLTDTAAASAGARPYLDASGLTSRQRVDVLSHISLLSHLDSNALGQLVGKGAVDRWPEGASVIRQSEKGEATLLITHQTPRSGGELRNRLAPALRSLDPGLSRTGTTREMFLCSQRPWRAEEPPP